MFATVPAELRGELGMREQIANLISATFDGMNQHASLDNHGVFANSTAGLAVEDKPFMPDPGKGRAGLDMYSNPSKEEFGLHMSKEGPKKRDNINETD